MTIIEAALEKQKALRGVRPDTHSHGQVAPGAPPVSAPPPAAPSPTATASPTTTGRRSGDFVPTVRPSTQIQAHRVTFDPKHARENRLLLNSSVAEDRGTIAAYGMLRTRILHRARPNNWHIIGVTSAAPQDGKSLTTVNLALSLAREKNSSVILLDLDMRNPSVCRTLGITPPVELRSFFEQRVDSPKDLFMSIGLDNFLVAGNLTTVENSAELLASTRLEDLFSYIKQMTTNPLILCDLPPALSPDDTLVVAPRIDALVVVASEGITPRSDLQKAADLLKDFPIAGMVLNRSTDFSQKYGYGYGGGDGAT